ncbi:MAG: leucyl aminopeptidase [Actinobacteria bacterium]|nr:leucyl aminopeptidase [Actinomycetota bacterium]
MPLEITSSTEEPLTSACDTLVVGAFADDKSFSLSPSGTEVDAAMDKRLSAYLRSSGFKAAPGEVAVVPAFGALEAVSIAVAGLGPKENVAAAEVRRAAGASARRLSQRKVVASTLHEAGDGATGKAAAEGYLLGSYRFTKYKSEPHPSELETVKCLAADEQGVAKGAVYAAATLLARDLINEPPSSLWPDELARRAEHIASDEGLDCTIWDENDLAERGFGGLLTVGQGSARPPRLIQLRYTPSGAKNAKSKVCIIGKGVTFDSGGLSLKDAKNMEHMKTDMSGSAAVIGALSALARLAPSVEVIGIVAATENMPGPGAVKPGDVITHYGGVTSEVLNTDAEGRLILADALAFASRESPDAIVDVATLTGSILGALGRMCTGLFANNDDLANELQSAATSAGERMWRMPLFDDYASELDSPVADIKNIGSRYGGAILAALFLKKFVGEDVSWAHLDIAGTSMVETDTDESPRGGTGVATRTFLSWIEDLSK